MEKGESIEPHELYGVQPVARSRSDSLAKIKDELQREMARRAGVYGRRLLEISGALEAARSDFEEVLESLRMHARSRFGRASEGWPWIEVADKIKSLPPDGSASPARALRALEGCSELHFQLRTQWAAAKQNLIIHREAMGFRRHHLVEEKFPAPEALPPLEAAWPRADKGIQ